MQMDRSNIGYDQEGARRKSTHYYSKAKELIFSLKENNEKNLKSLNETLEINKKLEEKNRNLEQNNNSIEPKESFNKVKEEIWSLIKTISPNIIPLDLIKINEKDIPLDKCIDLLMNKIK